MFPRLRTSFQQGGVNGIALLGPGRIKPDLPIDGLQLSPGLQVHLYEKVEEVDGKYGYLHVDGVVAGWGEKYQCWFATYDFDALKWTPELEGVTNLIPFDQWVERVFALAVDESWWKEGTAWDDLPPLIELDYLSRLFEASGELLSSYSDEQVNRGLHYCIDLGTGNHAFSLLDLNIPWPIRLRCVRSILRLFEMFAARCSPHLSHLDEPGANPLNSICYMFWDILPIHGSLDDSTLADLNHSLLNVMVDTLRLHSDACREAALHGLGHWQINYPNEVEQIIATFLAENPNTRPELRQYAERARIGHVQ